MELVFLGTGAGNGVPVFYCQCEICREAQKSERLRRTRSAICIIGERNYLIDAPPELSAQLLREHVTSVDHLFLTHAHHDHCAGLGDLEIYARFFLKGKIKAVMSRETWEQLKKKESSMSEWMEPTLIEPGHTINLSGVSFTGVAVSHCRGALGYLIEHEGRKTAYLPDTGPLPENSMSLLKKVDTLILDATFHGENWYPEQHLSVDEAIQIARELEVGKLYLTHLSMHYSQPVTNEILQCEIAEQQGLVDLAYDGLRLPLTGAHQ